MSTPAAPSLAQKIRTEIARQGAIPFCRFMELALYDERWGYYARSRHDLVPDARTGGSAGATQPSPEAATAFQSDPFGVRGDYFTNSQLQPVFGRLIAQQIARWRDEMGAPAGFSVLELGSGRGETTEALHERLPGVRVAGLDYDSGESGGEGAGQARGELSETGFVGVVFSNEFFDALPVHSVEKRDSRIVERYVEPDGEGFRFVDGAPSDPRLAGYLNRYVPGLADGQRIEVNLAALDRLERIAATLDRGYVLTIDYGYTVEQIAGGRRFSSGSLMSYVKHQASGEVLADPGNRDITAHVNFTALEKRGEELGLVSQGLRTQTQFLIEIGEPDQFAAALDAETEQESFRLRMQLKTLLFGLGESFQVLVQRKL